MKVFYIRCSMVEQNEGRQVEQAKEIGADKIFIDKASGKNTNRPQYKEMMSFVREGDTVYCSDISRIARNTKDLLFTVEELTKKGVGFVSLKESIDTNTPAGKFMLTVFGAMAELERENILQRQKEGIELAKQAGKYRGRKPIVVDDTKFNAVCKKWRSGEITARRAMEILELKTNTFYKLVKEKGV